MSGALLSRNRVLLLVSVSTVVAAGGVAVYGADRPAEVWLQPDGWKLNALSGLMPAWLSGPLPSFAHSFSFSVVTALVLPFSRGWATASCVAWLAINLLFEAGQHESVAPSLVTAADGIPQFVPRSERVGAYFGNGWFDPWDMIAAAVGAVCAFLLLRLALRSIREQP